jgi:hypothetical protein
MTDMQNQITALIEAQIKSRLEVYIAEAADKALAQILGPKPTPNSTWAKVKAAPVIKAKPPRRPSRRLSAGNNALVSLVSYAGGVGPMKFKAGKRNAKVWAFIKKVLSDGHEVPRVALTKHAAAACGSNYACISRNISVFLEKRMLTTRPNPEK